MKKISSLHRWEMRDIYLKYSFLEYSIQNDDDFIKTIKDFIKNNEEYQFTNYIELFNILNNTLIGDDKIIYINYLNNSFKEWDKIRAFLLEFSKMYYKEDISLLYKNIKSIKKISILMIYYFYNFDKIYSLLNNEEFFDSNLEIDED